MTSAGRESTCEALPHDSNARFAAVILVMAEETSAGADLLTLVPGKSWRRKQAADPRPRIYVIDIYNDFFD